MDWQGKAVRVAGRLLRGISLFVILWTTDLPAAQQAEKTVLFVGKTGAIPSRVEKFILPIAEHLATRLGDTGIETGVVIVPADPKSMIDLLREKNIDIIFDSPLPTVQYLRAGVARPLLLGSRHGQEEFSSLIFVRKDSGLRTLQGLKGKMVAFEDPGSTTGYFLPRYTFERMGLPLVETADVSTPIPTGKIGYLFADDELNITSWVFHGKVAAGAINSVRWTEQKSNPETYRRDFLVIHRTQALPGLLVSVRSDIDRHLADRLTEILLGMHLDPDGSEALLSYNIDYFKILPAGLFAPVDAIYRHFESSR